MNSSAQLTVLVIFLARESNIKQTEGPGRKIMQKHSQPKTIVDKHIWNEVTLIHIIFAENGFYVCKIIQKCKHAEKQIQYL